jgi:long-subunit fatty acid transport protein
VKASAIASLAALLVAAPVQADTASLFGFGARSAGLARAGVADDDAGAAARENAALASTPGLRVRVGYGYGAMGLTFDGHDAGLPHASGVDIAAQYGVHVARLVDVGAALALHLPDSDLASITFHPGSEPQFPLYEAPLQRTSFDLVAAVRIGPVSFGGGAAVGLSVGGSGTHFTLGQDAHGTSADGSVDVALPYRVSPIVAARGVAGRLALTLSLRGPMSLDLALDNAALVTIQNNPLNGTTLVKVRGTNGWDPAVVTFGAEVGLVEGLAVMGSLEYALYSGAPPPVANVEIDVNLGTTPGLRQVTFPLPRFRDTIAPRLALEYRRPVEGQERWRWAVRLGYAVQPSPVPRQSGLTTYADATRHQVAVGGGYHFGRAAGVDWSIEAAGQVHVFQPRSEDKDSPALPYAHFDVGGHIVYGATTLEAAW